MLREEFLDLVDNLAGEDGFAVKRVSYSDYNIIETVYMHYPGINTKNDIAELYYGYGMALIKDMLPRAIRMRDLNKQQDDMIQELNRIRHKLESEAKGE